ncbi:hypothetical protein RRG08_014065 [Elysia crispata]|uniref:Uncharacterized protein n=1 Tax=Elysia crispata TaxID=231223 RepID=A0AAE1DQX3_9GAST|nr:hypothetical protein RRG08_014065 [Elysia crispata]
MPILSRGRCAHQLATKLLSGGAKWCGLLRASSKFRIEWPEAWRTSPVGLPQTRIFTETPGDVFSGLTSSKKIVQSGRMLHQLIKNVGGEEGTSQNG